MNLTNSLIQKLRIDERPRFSKCELNNIGRALLQQEKTNDVAAPHALNQPLDHVCKTPESMPHSIISKSSDEFQIRCKKCHSSESLSANYGRYGYYVTCGDCSCNTSMKSNCPSCESSQTRVQKRKGDYSLICNECDFTVARFISADANVETVSADQKI